MFCHLPYVLRQVSKHQERGSHMKIKKGVILKQLLRQMLSENNVECSNRSTSSPWRSVVEEFERENATELDGLTEALKFDARTSIACAHAKRTFRVTSRRYPGLSVGSVVTASVYYSNKSGLTMAVYEEA